MPQILKRQDTDSAKRAATVPKKIVKRKVDPDIAFTPHKSKVIGPVTRDKIYDHL